MGNDQNFENKNLVRTSFDDQNKTPVISGELLPAKITNLFVKKSPDLFVSRIEEFAFVNNIKTKREIARRQYEEAKAARIRGEIELQKAYQEAYQLGEILEDHSISITAKLDKTRVEAAEAKRQADQKEELDEIVSLENKVKIAQLKKDLKRLEGGGDDDAYEEQARKNQKRLDEARADTDYKKQKAKQDVAGIREIMDAAAKEGEHVLLKEFGKYIDTEDMRRVGISSLNEMIVYIEAALPESEKPRFYREVKMINISVKSAYARAIND